MASLDLVIASSNPRLRDGLRALSALGNFRIAGEGQSPDETIQLVALYRPQALVAEDELVARDATLIGRCRLCCPELKIVLVEGPVDFVNTSAPVDALVRRTSSLAALARAIESLFAEN